MSQEKQALIAFGGNAPWDGREPADTIRTALAALGQAGLPVLAASRIYRTPCFPAGAGPDYANAAARIAVPPDMPPDCVLARLHAVEAAFGRARSLRWGQRTLDIDLLAMGDLVQPDRAAFERWRDLPADRQVAEAPDCLILPHPRLQDRAFVLVPLAEVAPDWRHPVSGLSVLQMRDALPPAALAEVVPM